MRFWVVVFVLMMAPLAFADVLEVEKIAEPATVESGGTVRILLNISNPFDEEFLVKIRDVNSLGGTTVDTQCIQGRIPANAVGISEYESVQVHNPGTFTLGTIACIDFFYIVSHRGLVLFFCFCGAGKNEHFDLGILFNNMLCPGPAV